MITITMPIWFTWLLVCMIVLHIILIVVQGYLAYLEHTLRKLIAKDAFNKPVEQTRESAPVGACASNLDKKEATT